MANRQLLALRPANAARQLGKSPLAVLGLRQVLPVLQRLGRPLWLVVLEQEGQAEAVLRAAARMHAVAGLCLWPGECPASELRFRYSPEKSFREVCRAAAAVENCGPFLLHAQLSSVGPVEALYEFAHACVEAGFTSLGVAPFSGRFDAQLAARLLSPAQQYELGVMAGADEPWREGLLPQSLRLDVWLGEGNPNGTARGWAARYQPPPLAAPAEVVMGPLEKGASKETTEALSYAAALEYLESYALSGTAELLEKVFGSR
jgi:hypothetical protein